MDIKKTMASKNAGLGAVLKRKGKGSDLLNIHAKGKGQNAMKPSKAKGLPRVTKGRWSEYVESFNKPSGAERQASHYSKGNDWSK